MTNREIIDLRKLAMKLIRDEDAVQEFYLRSSAKI
jgi:hypothetical protein